MGEGRRSDGNCEFQTEKDLVGGSSGKNGIATITQWKTLMSAPTKGVKFNLKTRLKPKKKITRGARSRNGEGHGVLAQLGKTVSSQLEKKGTVWVQGKLGTPMGVSTVKNAKETRNLTCLIDTIHCIRPNFDKGKIKS